MKNFPDSSAQNMLISLRGGTIQSLAITGASITLVIFSDSANFEIGSLGEVKLKNGEGDPKDIFLCTIEESSNIISGQISNLSADGKQVILEIENGSCTLTFERGIDYSVEVAEVARTKGPAFFFG